MIMKFRVNGSFRERGKMKPFSKQIEADNKKGAEERVLSLLGSNHKLKRWEIKIDEVKEVR
jgi:large subunit ribosomal protein LX